jgi:hypothetical protein
MLLLNYNAYKMGIFLASRNTYIVIVYASTATISFCIENIEIT